MSHTIIYDRLCASIPGLPGEQVLFLLEGPNNCYVGNRRSRSINAAAIGTTAEMIDTCLEWVSESEGGMIKWEGRDANSESLIKSFRQASLEADHQSGWQTMLRLLPDQLEMLYKLAPEARMWPTSEKLYGLSASRSVVTPPDALVWRELTRALGLHPRDCAIWRGAWTGKWRGAYDLNY